jgi:hypothetical protein
VLLHAAASGVTLDERHGTVYVVSDGGSDHHGFRAATACNAARTVDDHYLRVELGAAAIRVSAVRPDGGVIDSSTR